MVSTHPMGLGMVHTQSSKFGRFAIPGVKVGMQFQNCESQPSSMGCFVKWSSRPNPSLCATPSLNLRSRLLQGEQPEPRDRYVTFQW